jgi:hypothetical protein
MHPARDQMHVDEDLAGYIELAVLNRKGEHSGDYWGLGIIMFPEWTVLQTPDSDTNKPKLLTDLGNSLMERFKRLGNDANLERAVSAFEDAVQLTPDGDPDKPGRLSTLGGDLERAMPFDAPPTIIRTRRVV